MKLNKKIKNSALFILIILGVFWYYKKNIQIAFLNIHSNDFKHLYTGADVIRNGGNPYNPRLLFETAHLHNITSLNPYVYLPFTGIVLSPLTYLSFPAAAKTWFALNHIFLWSGILLTFIAIREKVHLGSIAAAAVYSSVFFPFYRTLTAGQLNCALLFLFSLILFFDIRKKYFWAGIVTAFAALFKLSPGILLLYFLLKLEWETLWWCGVGLYLFGIIRLFFMPTDTETLIYIVLLSVYIVPLIISTFAAYVKKRLDIFIIGILSFSLSHIFLISNLDVLQNIVLYLKDDLSTIVIDTALYPVFFIIYYIILLYLYPLLKERLKNFPRMLKVLLIIITINTGIVVLAASSILLFILNVPKEFLPLLKAMNYGSSTWGEVGMTFYIDPFNQSFNALYHHLFAANSVTKPLWNIGANFANLLTKITSLILLIIAIIFSVYKNIKIKTDTIAIALDYSLFIFLSVLIPSLFWDHYIVIVLLPIIVMFIIMKNNERIFSIKNMLLFSIYLISLYFLAIPFAFQSPEYREGLKIFLMSFKLYFVMILFGLNCWLLKERRRKIQQL